MHVCCILFRPSLTWLQYQLQNVGTGMNNMSGPMIFIDNRCIIIFIFLLSLFIDYDDIGDWVTIAMLMMMRMMGMIMWMMMNVMTIMMIMMMIMMKP